MQVLFYKLILFIPGLLLIEGVIYIVKGFVFYDAPKDKQHKQSKESWKLARRLICFSTGIMFLATVFYLVFYKLT